MLPPSAPLGVLSGAGLVLAQPCPIAAQQHDILLASSVGVLRLDPAGRSCKLSRESLATNSIILQR